MLLEENADLRENLEKMCVQVGGLETQTKELEKQRDKLASRLEE